MSARILLVVLILMIGSIMSIVFLQRVSGVGGDKQPPEGELLSTPSRMSNEQ